MVVGWSCPACRGLPHPQSLSPRVFRQGWTPSGQHGPRGLREGAVWGEMDINISLMILFLQHPFFSANSRDLSKAVAFLGLHFLPVVPDVPWRRAWHLCESCLTGKAGLGTVPPPQTTDVTLWPVLTQKRGPVSTGGAAGPWECRRWGCRGTHLKFSADLKSTSRSLLQLLISEELGSLSSRQIGEIGRESGSAGTGDPGGVTASPSFTAHQLLIPAERKGLGF